MAPRPENHTAAASVMRANCAVPESRIDEAVRRLQNAFDGVTASALDRKTLGPLLKAIERDNAIALLPKLRILQRS